MTTLYKRGTKSAAKVDVKENAQPSTPSNEKTHEKMEAAASELDAPKTTDVFTWQHLNYTVPIAGQDDRTLLNDISGFVAPGKLTALMGESGAGKTTLLNVLAKRVYSGVVTGETFVSGQPLPADFQSQTYVCSFLPSSANSDLSLPAATVSKWIPTSCVDCS